jgi:hypothetical protein
MFRSLTALLLTLALAPMAYSQEGTEPLEPSSQPEALQPASAETATAEAEEEEESGIEYGAEVAFLSNYLFYGISFSSGLIAQPYAYVTKGDFTVDFYISPVLNAIDEVPFIDSGIGIGHNKEFGDLALTSYFYLYGSPILDDAGNSEFDISGVIQVDAEYALGPVTAYLQNVIGVVDPEEIASYWGELGVSHEHAFGEKLTVAGKLGLAFATEKWTEFNAEVDLVSGGGLNSVNAEVSAEYYVTDAFFARPWVQLANVFKEELFNEDGGALFINLGFAAGASF